MWRWPGLANSLGVGLGFASGGHGQLVGPLENAGPRDAVQEGLREREVLVGPLVGHHIASDTLLWETWQVEGTVRTRQHNESTTIGEQVFGVREQRAPTQSSLIRAQAINGSMCIGMLKHRK